MEIDRKELKRQAREAMALPRPNFWVVTLVYLLMTTGLADLLDGLMSAVSDNAAFTSLFLTILLTLYNTVVGFGYKLWSLWTVRRLDPGLGALVQGFSIAGRVIWLEVSLMARVVLWCIPACFAVTLCIVLLPATPIVSLLSIGLLYVAVWVLMLRYALSPYLLADRPDDGVGAAIQRSVSLMRGWKWELFKLEFSFLGWNILSWALSGAVLCAALWHTGVFSLLVTGSIEQVYTAYFSVASQPWVAVLSSLISLPLSLWLTPYRTVSEAGFYDARARLYQANTPPML
jgi:uncharacterized membrane protein